MKDCVSSCDNSKSLIICTFPFSETNTATMTLFRTGTYGPVSIPWQIGYRSGQEPGDGVLGSITPQTGTVTIPHGVDTKDFSVTVSLYLKTAWFGH